MPFKIIFRLTFIVVILFQISCTKNEFKPLREKMDLSGTWQFALDSISKGIGEKWFEQSLSEQVNLPGTLDKNNIGIPNTNRDETMRLSRERMYDGKAWYQKKINISETWKNKEIILTLERTKPTKVWVDKQFVDENSTILSAQKYNLTEFLSPGEHTLTILVDNGPNSVPKGIQGSHAWTEHTQTNWNGIIGKISLEATSKSFIRNLNVTPDIENKQAVTAISIYFSGKTNEEVKLKLYASAWNTKAKHNVPVKTFKTKLNPGENRIVLKYEMGNKVQLWSEFSPASYLFLRLFQVLL